MQCLHLIYEKKKFTDYNFFLSKTSGTVLLRSNTTHRIQYFADGWENKKGGAKYSPVTLKIVFAFLTYCRDYATFVVNVISHPFADEHLVSPHRQNGTGWRSPRQHALLELSVRPFQRSHHQLLGHSGRIDICTKK